MKIKNILVSQNAPEDIERSPYGDLKKKYSINIDFYKFFKINCTTAIDFRKTHINILDYESIVFSSTNTIDKFFELCKDMRLEMPESMKYFCATESIALYLQKYVPYRKRRVFSAKDAQVSSFAFWKRMRSSMRRRLFSRLHTPTWCMTWILTNMI